MLALVLTAGLSSGSVAAEETPNEVVESAVALFAESLDGRREELAADRAALYELIDEILLPRFDRKFAAKTWKLNSPTGSGVCAAMATLQNSILRSAVCQNLPGWIIWLAGC